MLTNCLHEKERRCIPAGVGQCDTCTSFKLDTDRCINYGEYGCTVKKECPCKNYEPKNNEG